MTDSPANSDRSFSAEELRPYVDRAEIAETEAAAARLIAERPLPRAAFRSQLRAGLIESGADRPAWRPRRLRVLVWSYVSSGAGLLAVAAVGLAGLGPLS
jgi:hypothetical protein